MIYWCVNVNEERKVKDEVCESEERGRESVCGVLLCNVLSDLERDGVRRDVKLCVSFFG